MIYSSVRWKSFCVYCYLSTIPHSKGNPPDGYGFSLIGISPFWGSLRTAPIAWVCGWTEVSLYSLPVIALITVPCNVQVLKAAAFACVARPLRDSRKNVSDVLYIQLSKCFENFFISHLYSRIFRVLITKDFTFFHFLLFTQFLKTIFSDYSNNWFMTGEFFHKNNYLIFISKKIWHLFADCPCKKRKSVSDGCMSDCKVLWENFFTSHLYSQNFRVLITKNFTFFHFLPFAQFSGIIFSYYSDSWFYDWRFFS